MSNINPVGDPQIRLKNQARAIVAMGFVGRDFEGFNVTAPGFVKETYRVWKDEGGVIRCSCGEHDEKFRCVHMLAVDFHVAAEGGTFDCAEDLPAQPSLPDERNAGGEEKPTYSWQFDPLSNEPNNIEITCNGVAFMRTSTLSNAQAVCGILNEHQSVIWRNGHLVESVKFTINRLSHLPSVNRTPEERLEELTKWIEDEILPTLEDAMPLNPNSYKSLQAQNQALVGALQNMVGAFDNPICRRVFHDDFTEEAVRSAKEALAPFITHPHFCQKCGEYYQCNSGVCQKGSTMLCIPCFDGTKGVSA